MQMHDDTLSLNTQQQYFGYPSPSSNSIGGQTPSVGSPSWSPRSPQHGVSPRIPPPDALLKGYKRTMNGTNAVAGQDDGGPSRSSRLDTSDSVAMHLLLETAMADSQNFRIQSFEEVEELKKTQFAISSRMSAVRQKLALESKVRDAAKSLQRLYSEKGRTPSAGSISKPGLNRRTSLLSSRGSISTGRPDSLHQTEDELAASSKKVDELSRELWQLETQHRDVQYQLLRHTAGILQMAANQQRPSKLKQLQAFMGTARDGQPDSPGSTFKFGNEVASGSLAVDDDFDDRSLYQSPDALDGVMDRFGKRRSSRAFPEDMSGSLQTQNQHLVAIGERLEAFNDRMRELITGLNSEIGQTYATRPESGSGATTAQPMSEITQQLDNLDKGLHYISVEQADLQRKAAEALRSNSGQLEHLNHQIYDMIRASDAEIEDQVPVPPPPDEDTANQLDYLEESLQTLNILHQDLSVLLHAKSKTATEQSEQYEAVLASLWSMIISSEEKARQHHQNRREMLGMNTDLAADDDDLSDEPGSPIGDGSFSLPAFSAKVQWLHSRAISLAEQKAILKRQIKQQRELNHKSDTEKDAEIASLTAQLGQASLGHTNAGSALAQLERELNHAREAMARLHSKEDEDRDAIAKAEEHVAALTADLEDARDDARIAVAEWQAKLADAEARASGAAAAEARSGELAQELEAHRARTAELEHGLQETEQRLAELETLDQRLQATTAQLSASQTELLALHHQLSEKTTEAARAATELHELESEVVRLTTDLTVSRAELDGAYGTRAQRAAEVAANPEIKRELDELGAHNLALQTELDTLRASEVEKAERTKQLEVELQGLLRGFEALTRAGLEAEREREKLEGVVDGLREGVEGLEARLADERVRWLGIRSPGGGGGGDRPGAGVVADTMRNEFRKMMKETRAEFARVLKAETDERKRLENLVRAMRREHLQPGPGKSGLSHSTTA
ncbi:hypothetical protein W97_08372 [Coniosporium apollinis CBS 100218]|uniref:Uncharacterized protein n=1 Tax=Coniosporium apollinis (strain CBS 100218) TaxID=1168221 RepID=R7Z4X2_CONA1|nr:uncharacterized protein W97_08372 [Coniosporium apollinis CBS 100218]EON69059.1 hypothetical protein W97_08372 [Coniosporium apollinis CBS 100218]